MSERFRRRGEQILASLPAAEVELLRTLPGELRAVFDGPADPEDGVYARFFPRAYLDPTEEMAEQEWRELVHPELLRQRVAALELVSATLARGQVSKGRVEVELAPEEVEAWLGVLNDARLALGTRLGVTEDLDERVIDPSDPNAAAHAIYGWLTWLEGDLVETLLE
jgi:hypothetical protein